MELENEKQVLEWNKTQCQAAIAAFRRDLQKVRTGRASTGLVEGVSVDYYGSKVPLGTLAQISTPEARLITIQVYDTNAVQSIEKAIMSSGLGLTPSTEGNVIRLQIPTLTEESRKDLIRVLNKMAEDIRVSIRSHRRDSNESLKRLEKDGALTKDDSKRLHDDVQKQVDVYIGEIQKLLEAKEAEIMEV